MRLTLGAAAAASVVTVAIAMAPTAVANGPCGNDYDSNTACGVSASPSGSTYPGSIATQNDTDFYVFWGAKGTNVTATITDTIDPTCNSSNSTYDSCGDVQVRLLDATAEELAGSNSSTPGWPGVTVPQSMAYTLTSSGIYYLTVSGDMASDSHGSPLATPYSLSVAANPGVQWPAPPPPQPPAPTPPAPKPPAPKPQCVVHGWHGTRNLAQAERLIKSWNCRIGAIHHARNRARRGVVFGLGHKVGTRWPNGTRIAIWVSKGR